MMPGPIKHQSEGWPRIWRSPLKDELDGLVCEGILVKMDPDQPSDWLNSFKYIRKPDGKIRLCLDLTQSKKNVTRPSQRHNAQILDALLPRLAGQDTL